MSSTSADRAVSRLDLHHMPPFMMYLLSANCSCRCRSTARLGVIKPHRQIVGALLRQHRAQTPATTFAQIIVTVGAMVDAVPATARRPSFQPDDLADQTRSHADRRLRLQGHPCGGPRVGRPAGPLVLSPETSTCRNQWGLVHVLETSARGRPAATARVSWPLFASAKPQAWRSM